MGGVGIVVVDPQRAFTDPGGCIGRIHPPSQFGVIRQTVERLETFVSTERGPKLWVRADYSPGQFSGGDLDHPLAYLCVPGRPEHDWEPRLLPPQGARVVPKTTVDANSSPEFVTATEALVGSVEALFVTGFWLTACVAATAMGCAARLAGRLPVVLPLSLTATRVGLYDPADDHPVEVDVTAVLARLRDAGVLVCESPDDWRSATSVADTQKS